MAGGLDAGLIDRLEERGVVDGLVDTVHSGQSAVLVIYGDPGIGKTALLGYLVERTKEFRTVRAAGVQSEMELPFAGLHQICTPLLEQLDRVPAPQAAALRTAFGLAAGPSPDRFLVGLAVLSLLSVAAGNQPLIGIVDDAQWLDRASAQALGFAARRLGAEPVGLVFATRTLTDDFVGVPSLEIAGLRESDARELLDAALAGPVDPPVRDRIIAETHGNPLALLELPRGLTPAELAGGFGLPTASYLPGRIEESFLRQISALPKETYQILLLAAAEPSGNTALVWQAAARLGIGADAAVPAAEAGLAEFGPRLRFRHPLVRSAAYRSASTEERRAVHAALAEVTDGTADPDRRAWHRARAATGPDEEIAGELERSAGRAQARGGLAAAAAFLEQAALMTPDWRCRTARIVAAATAKRDAGDLDGALGQLVSADAWPLDERLAAEVAHLRGQIASDQRRGEDAAQLLLGAARSFEQLDPPRARTIYLEAIWASIWAGDLDALRRAAASARAMTPDPGPQRPVDVVLDALSVRFTEGYAAAAAKLKQANELVVQSGDLEEVARWNWNPGALVALEMWDFDAWHAIALSQARMARDIGALVNLQFALTYLARIYLLIGDLGTAVRLIEEDRMIADATGNPPFEYSAMMIAAWRGDEAGLTELAKSHQSPITELGIDATITACTRAVLYNGIGRYDLARASVEPLFRLLQPDPAAYVLYTPVIVPELAEAAYRSGQPSLVRDALAWLTERSERIPNDWVLGITARVRAFLQTGSEADASYLESVQRLGRTRQRSEFARSALLYGEWLRGEGRKAEAREQLRVAYRLFVEMGADAFAERARRQLSASGEAVNRASAGDSGLGGPASLLTSQELTIAVLARDGMSNPEIAARLFISARTVQYHLKKVFAKLDITSRRDLYRVLPADRTGD